jgi:hypothetical protein|nr:hypothetical protein [uncultured bacterium]
MVQCLVFLAQKCTNDGFGPAYYWLQSADRAWCIHAPVSSFELESALVHLPSSVFLNFNRLEPAMNRGEDLWTLRLGTTEMDEADLVHDWVAAPHPHVTFSEPVDEGNDDIDIPVHFSS